MSKKIAVHHSKTLGYAGTDRTAQIFCKYLAQSDEYQPIIMYREGDDISRLDKVAEFIGRENLVSYKIEHATSPISPFYPESSNFKEVLASLNPDIFHAHRSGYHEWPVMRDLMPDGTRIVETNIFGYADRVESADLNIYICEYIRQSAIRDGGPNGPILYNPIELTEYGDKNLTWQVNKAAAKEELINQYNLPKDADIIGRIGRADNFDPISLEAFKLVLETNPNTYYLVVCACDGWRNKAKELNIEDKVIFIDPIVDDYELSKLYCGMDIFAHARHDGECCSTSLQAAMMAATPCVSSVSLVRNGQAETIADGGFVVPIGDYVEYAKCVNLLLNDKELREQMGQNSLRRSMRHFEASCVTTNLMKYYDWVLSQ